MPNGNLLAALMLNSGLAQYPDPSLYQAATMLKPEERPTVPVKVGDDKYRAINGTQASFYGNAESKYNPEQMVHIRVQQRSPAYKNFKKRPQRLAAVLAHEGAHSRGLEEAEAYQQEHDTLQRLGEKDREMLKLLLNKSRAERGAGNFTRGTNVASPGDGGK